MSDGSDTGIKIGLKLCNRHTSVVVFGKEVFYGQGINITAPGQSHVLACVYQMRLVSRFTKNIPNL